MTARTVVALAVLCAAACSEPPKKIRAEGHAREVAAEITGIADVRRGRFERPPPPPPICEVGQRKSCSGVENSVRLPSIPGPNGGPGLIVSMLCVRLANGTTAWSAADCNTPLVVAFDSAPVVFTRADAAFAVGVSERTEWVSAATPWLALDRDGSGCIESSRELFAGFSALAELDANLDGRIDARDPAFAELVLWSDRNQDKLCTADEISSLGARGIDALPLSFEKPEPPTRLGSYEGETARLPGGARLVDVYLEGLR